MIYTIVVWLLAIMYLAFGMFDAYDNVQWSESFLSYMFRFLLWQFLWLPIRVVSLVVGV